MILVYVLATSLGDDGMIAPRKSSLIISIGGNISDWLGVEGIKNSNEHRNKCKWHTN